MRHMSFALTTPQVLARTKTVTRRIGWRRLQPGTLLQPVLKCQGIKKGEHVQPIGGPIRVVRVDRERLKEIHPVDVAREGFPGRLPTDFIRLFCEHSGCTPGAYVTRIEFEYMETK